MKNRLITLMFSIVIISCYSKSKSKVSGYIKKPADTVSVLKAFVDMPTKSIKFDVVYRITKDTVTFVDADSLTKKKVFARDTTYYIPVYVQALKGITYLPAIRAIVYEGDRLDSALAILGRWMNEHKQFFPDSSKSRQAKH